MSTQGHLIPVWRLRVKHHFSLRIFFSLSCLLETQKFIRNLYFYVKEHEEVFDCLWYDPFLNVQGYVPLFRNL